MTDLADDLALIRRLRREYPPGTLAPVKRDRDIVGWVTETPAGDKWEAYWVGDPGRPILRYRTLAEAVNGLLATAATHSR